MRRSLIVSIAAILVLCNTTRVFAALPDIVLTGSKVQLLRPTALMSSPGIQTPCIASNMNNPGQYFNISIQKLTTNSNWFMAAQAGPHISGCGTPQGPPVSDDMTYLYKAPSPLGQYLPVSYDGSGEITCQEAKDHNISLFNPDKVDSCVLDEGFFGLGNLLITANDPSRFLLTQEAGFNSIEFHAYHTYYNVVNTDAKMFPSWDRRLIMSTLNVGKAQVKPLTFRYHLQDQFIPFFVGNVDPITFQNGGLLFGVIDFLTYPDSHNTWLQTGGSTLTRLTSGREAPSPLYSINGGPGYPSGFIKPFATVLGPLDNDGIDGYVVFYSKTVNGDGSSCLNNVDGKRSLISYSGFNLSTFSTPRGNIPIFSGWTGQNKNVKKSDGTDYSVDGWFGIFGVYIYPTSTTGGYLFWTEATNCNGQFFNDMAVFGQAYVIQ